MNFKIDKKLICDICGSNVKVAKEDNCFNCSNSKCPKSVIIEVTFPDVLPEWVVTKNNYKNLKF